MKKKTMKDLRDLHYSEEMVRQYKRTIQAVKRSGLTIEDLLNSLPEDKREEMGKALLAGHQNALNEYVVKRAKRSEKEDG